MKMIEEVYAKTSEFPKEETYGLVAQIRRAAVSVASNIAEGCARRSNPEKIQFLNISKGSLSEIDAQIEIALRLGYIKKEAYEILSDRIDRVSSMLQGLINSRL